MQERWSLDELYKGYNDPAYSEDLKKVDELIAKINALPEKLGSQSAKENVLEYINLSEEFALVSRKLASFSHLQMSANTQDVESASYLGRLSMKLNGTTKADTVCKKYIAKLENLDEIIASDEKLQQYSYMLHNLVKDDAHMLSDEVEEALALMDLSGANAWSDLQSSLTSTVRAVVDGKEVSLSAVRNMAYDTDAEVRKKAYEAELACYPQVADSVAFALNNIKLQALSECKLRGYDSILDKTLYTSRMKKETLDALLGAINDYLPKFHEYLQLKAKALGHENGLPWYDLFAPLGKNDKEYSLEDAREYLLKLFNAFNPRLAEIVDRAMEENWIDYYPRDGKVGGAFCSGLPAIKQFRILTNYDGTLSDVVTLAHELGHGYHDVMMDENLPLNRRISMCVAETASTFNENIVMNSAIALAETDEEKLALIESQLQDTTQIICDILSRFLFEKELCDRRSSEFMSQAQLCDIMLRAQKQAYGNGLDHDQLHPYMWLCKSHYYSAGLGFYNFPYAFGGLFARGLYEKYKVVGKKEFLPKYNEMLATTPLYTVEDAAKICGIDVTDKAFWGSALKAITDNVDVMRELIEKGVR